MYKVGGTPEQYLYFPGSGGGERAPRLNGALKVQTFAALATESGDHSALV